jgi:hypothetical protein
MNFFKRTDRKIYLKNNKYNIKITMNKTMFGYKIEIDVYSNNETNNLIKTMLSDEIKYKKDAQKEMTKTYKELIKQYN